MKHNYRWVLNMAVLIAVALAVAVTVLGVLAIPVVLSVIYSWY